jgi:Tol biopolymer transport system component
LGLKKLERFQRLRWIGIFFLLLSSLCPLCSTTSFADGIGDIYSLSPFWDWKQIETKHFRITFPADLADTAERAANYLEDAHTAMSKSLYWEAHYKTPILLIDNADSANGVTTPIGRFGIVLYATPPDNWFSTAYYDDWLRLLCYHEYTHFLNIDATRAFWQTGRYLFGDVLLPNAVWPSWMLEGLAVYNETRYGHAGRGRSPYYDMILRSAVEANVLDTGKFYTLDRINGVSVPYFPGGESVYLFGYEMMNEVAKNNQAGPTFDGQGQLKSGQDALGVMSERSSWRFPWFINGNLENITGRSWYSYWDQFIKETKERATKELALIRSQPISTVHRITQDGYNVLGSSFSPDGQWVAYSDGTLDERNGLFLKNLKTGKIERVADKISGAQVSFTPDSKYVLMSSLKRESQYYLFSEVAAYSIENKSVKYLTSKQRARDPDVSRDGKFVAFTTTQDGRASLARASLGEKDGNPEMKDIEVLIAAKKYDVISTPKFSPDGRTVYYSIHQNGNTSEELMAFDIASARSRVLVKNGHFNRFPAVNSRGQVFFVSDLTGVDNVYQVQEGSAPKLQTNLTTGVAFPSFTSGDQLFGAVASYTGWDLAQIDPLSGHVAPSSITVAKPSAPTPDSESDIQPATEKYAVEDYSVVPSIWPRGWIPYAYVAPSNVSFGEAVAGFDAVDRHRYLADVGYDTLSSAVDWLGIYQNRSIGPTFSFIASDQFSYAQYAGSSVAYYVRDELYSIGASFENFWTYSSLTPSVSMTFDRTSYYFPNTSGPTLQTSFLPDLDAVLSFSDTKQSKLSIVPEEGRQFIVGGRYFINNGNQTGAVKGLLADTEYLRLGKSHAVFSPSFKGSVTSAVPSTNPNQNSDVIVQGYYPLIFASPVLLGINGLPPTSLSRLPIRGYPYAAFYEKAALISAADLYFPISDLFRGWGTNPVFLDQIYGNVFGEMTYLPAHESELLPFLPSAGGGITVNMELLLQIPVAVSMQYQYGFQTQAQPGPSGNLIVDMGYSGAFY